MPLLVKHPPGVPLTCGCGKTINDGKAVCGIFSGIPCDGSMTLPPKGFNTEMYMRPHTTKKRIRLEDVSLRKRRLRLSDI